MAKEVNKGLGLVILGIVAVIAIVGLVLLFTNHSGSTGQGIYGGAIRGLDFPDWTGRGVPRNMVQPQVNYPTLEESWPRPDSKQKTTNWNYNAAPKRSPQLVNSNIRKCIGGMLIQENYLEYYRNKGYSIDCSVPYGKPGCCVSPGSASMLGGIAGQ